MIEGTPQEQVLDEGPRPVHLEEFAIPPDLLGYGEVVRSCCQPLYTRQQRKLADEVCMGYTEQEG
jgi:hypothetical protein